MTLLLFYLFPGNIHCNKFPQLISARRLHIERNNSENDDALRYFSNCRYIAQEIEKKKKRDENHI